jgi:two-component system NarL family sensor kinase
MRGSGAEVSGDPSVTSPSVPLRRNLLGRDGTPARPAGGSRRKPAWRGSIERLVILYMCAALGAFILCGVGLALAQRHAALAEAVRDARTTATLLTARVVQPALPPRAPAGLDTDQTFDQVIRQRLLGAPLTQARIVDESGLVVYASEPGVVGQREELSAEELEALRTAVATASRDDGSDPVDLLGGRADRSLDVSAGLKAPSGQLLLLQTSQPFQVVWLTSRAVWLSLLPSLIMALVLLYLVKIGFTYRLTRSLHNVQEEREQLLVTALAAADRERTLIASDLHDGVVQGLAGASYSLTDTANRTRAAGQPEVADSLAETARSLRQWVRELRSLIVTVTPPALHSEGLEATLTDLMATLEARRIDVDLDVRVGEGLTETGESLVYRVAQEAVRNIVRHANATRVHVVVADEDGWLQLQITDDGQGFDPSVSARRQGSVGLPLLAALVQERGGSLRVASATASGTSVTLRLPLDTTDRSGTRTSKAAP